MKLLITGAAGQLGRALVQQGRDAGFDIVATDLPELDICREMQVAGALAQERPALVINAAAYTRVDDAESHPDAAFRINRDAAAILAAACRSAGIPMIHVSTDYVFDGLKQTPYLESDPVSPVGVYARSKAAGEKAIRSLLPAHVIVRTSWLFGLYGHNFVKTMLHLGKKEKRIPVVADQFGCPTSAQALAQALLEIAGQIAAGRTIDWGIYHFCGRGITTWYQFALKIFELAARVGYPGRPEPVPVSTGQYPTAARRPPCSALDCRRIGQAFGIRPAPWEQDLAEALDRLVPHEES